MTKYGFGWDEVSDAYKVFAVMSDQGQNIGKVYSTKTNSWKTVDHGCLSLFIEVGNFSCGKIHWLMKTGGNIESFDLKSEVFGLMEPPCEPGTRMWVPQRDGCLCVLCEYNGTRLDLWVMKKYGVKESWVKQTTASIPLEYESNYLVFFNKHDEGMTVTPWKTLNPYYIESLVSPVWNSRQDEIEQEQIREMVVVEGHPNRQIKRRPARLNKRKAAGGSVELTKESEEIEQEKARRSVVEGRPKCQNKKKEVRYGVEETKENQEMEQEKVDINVADGRPERQNRRRPARYGYEGTKENQEIEKEQVRATCVNEGRPKRQNRRRSARYGYEGTKENQEIEKEQVRATCANEDCPKRRNKRKETKEEQVHTSVAEGRPRRSTTRYGDQRTKEKPEIEKDQVRTTSVNDGRPKRQNKRKETEEEQVHTSVAEGRPKRQNRIVE